MEITWYGNSCFRMTERGVASIMTDPYESDNGLTLPRKDADVVTVSMDDSAHNNIRGIKAGFKAMTGPGEYEVGGVFITGIDIRPDRRKSDGRPRNTVFVFDCEGVTVCHLGALNHVPTQSQVEALGAVGVLLVPVGGAGHCLNASQAAEVVSLLEPSVVVPMHYRLKEMADSKFDPVTKFLKEMGLSEIAPQESLKATRSGLPDETQVVILASRAE